MTADRAKASGWRASAVGACVLAAFQVAGWTQTAYYKEKIKENGVILYRPDNLPQPKFVHTLAFRECEVWASIIYVTRPTGEKLTLHPRQVIASLGEAELALADTIITAEEIRAEEAKADRIVEYASTYPSFSKVIGTAVAKHKEAIRMLREDKVRVLGEWVSRREHANRVRESERAEAERQQWTRDAAIKAAQVKYRNAVSEAERLLEAGNKLAAELEQREQEIKEALKSFEREFLQ